MADHPKRILIVEDNDTDVRLLKDILETRGYNILQTKEGLEAIDLAVVNLPDLILMDIRLPHMSGLEVTRRLRSDSPSRKTSVERPGVRGSVSVAVKRDPVVAHRAPADSQPSILRKVRALFAPTRGPLVRR